MAINIEELGLSEADLAMTRGGKFKIDRSKKEIKKVKRTAIVRKKTFIEKVKKEIGTDLVRLKQLREENRRTKNVKYKKTNNVGLNKRRLRHVKRTSKAHSSERIIGDNPGFGSYMRPEGNMNINPFGINPFKTQNKKIKKINPFGNFRI